MKKLFSTVFLLWLLLPLWAAGEKELFVCSDGSQIVVAYNSKIYYAEYKNNRLSEKKPIGVLNDLLQQGWAVKNFLQVSIAVKYTFRLSRQVLRTTIFMLFVKNKERGLRQNCLRVR